MEFCLTTFKAESICWVTGGGVLVVEEQERKNDELFTILGMFVDLEKFKGG